MDNGGLAGLRLKDGTGPLAVSRALRNPRPVDTTTGVFAQVMSLAAEEPDRVAVLTDRRQVSYGDLYHRAGQFRTILLDGGCGRGDRIAVVGERGLDMIAAFLAIESIGGAYLPLDPAWPVARLAEVLRRTGPRCVLGLDLTEAGAGAVASASAVAHVPLRAAPGGTVPPSVPVAPVPVPKDEPRYVIHTSGSAGRPKGATVTHLGLMNHLRSMVASLDLSGSDTVAFSASPGYVISVWQMLAALLVGGRVAIVDEADMRFGRRLLGCLARMEITVVELVPTMIGWLVGETRKSSAGPPQMRCLLSTGEKLDQELAAQVIGTFPDVAFYNAYGSTECSDDVALHLFGPADLNRPRIPAGSPIPNAVLYLLVNEEGAWRSAEPGEPGELWVGGAGVGLGYLHEPVLTRQSFFVDSLDPDSPTGRLYRTGDLARFEDGLAYCLGRIDRQVKVAGVRIELDEIEAVLSRLPGVEWCAAVVEERNGQATLAIFYVAEADTSQEELYAPLRATLPRAMFPHRWTRLDSLPRNASGKVDYRALAGRSHA